MQIPEQQPAHSNRTEGSARAVRAATAAAAAFSAVTVAWIIVGLSNTGDAFPQGLARTLLPLPFVAPFPAAYLGWRYASRRALVIVCILAVPSIAFWTLARDGWWASELPPVGLTPRGTQ
jgi:hypothetical protein